MALRPDENDVLTCSHIQELTAIGKPRSALDLYANYVYVNKSCVSARTHHAAFVAARELSFSRQRLADIEIQAQSCNDYAGVELNFARDWAIYRAENARNEEDLQTANDDIDKVIEERKGNESEDQSQLLVDRLAKAKILLFAKEYKPASTELADLLVFDQVSGQLHLDASWWYFIATLVDGQYSWAYLDAKRQLAKSTDPKPSRRRVWWVTARIPLFGPSIACAVVKHQLGL